MLLNPYRFAATGPAPGTFYRFDASGSDESWYVPAGVTALKAYVFGASGGGGVYNNTFASGAGGYSEGELSVTPGEELVIRVGVGGAGGTMLPNVAGLGGWPGGGNGSFGDSVGGGGGGYSGVFRSDTTPIIIAGGGGSLAGWSSIGGAGGGSTGQTSGPGNSGGATGGTQSAGGTSTGGLTNGASLQGAHADNGNNTVSTGNDGGGAGGGYYGGGVMAGDAGAAAGGSGYIGGVTSGTTLTGSNAAVHASAPATVNSETVSPRGNGVNCVTAGSGAVAPAGNDGVIWFEVL